MKTSEGSELAVPPPHNWRTSDEDEINRRRLRARSEAFGIDNLDRRHPVLSNFRVRSKSGMEYRVEIRDLQSRQASCTCIDFRINGLGTCKHVEAVLLQLKRREKRAYAQAVVAPSPRCDLVLDPETNRLRLSRGAAALPARFRSWFDRTGALVHDDPADAVLALAKAAPGVRISQDVGPWVEARRMVEERRHFRRDYEARVQSGEWPTQETTVALFPYQREGMLHLAFNERALLADEMGLGKTIQAIAACALLRRLGQVERVLVVAPASLKSEWEEQIQRFTRLSCRLVFGPRRERLRAWTRESAAFFTVVNYEQIRSDALDLNDRLRPEVVVLDEAQRIKNWSTKTAQAVKRLRSRYAFVLTGTPIENRIDELYSLMDFVDPRILGPLFRFNREYYELDEKGRPAEYRNLAGLQERIRPRLLRRRKADVESELPDRTDKIRFVPLSPVQRDEYAAHEAQVARLSAISKRRPLNQREQDKLMRELAMMRMICDTTYILNPDDRTCPKLVELEKILDDCRENDAKAIVFSEWERMLELARDACKRLKLGYAWHTGGVPQQRRRAEINAFKHEPSCRVFLSTDAGAAGLNLQAASVVVNCDLPWSPAKLEQRIARAWRKHQTRAVTVINLVSEGTIEHRMLETLAHKRALSDGLLDRLGNLEEIKLKSGGQAFMARLEQLMSAEPTHLAAVLRPLPTDRSLGFAQAVRERINGALVHCEERYPAEGTHSVLYVVLDGESARWRPALDELHREFFGSGRADPFALVRLEVVDRVSHEALSRLAEAGLLAFTQRGSRLLFPSAPNEAPRALTAEEETRRDAHRATAGRKIRMAHVLGEAGMDDEVRAPGLEGALAMARALAIENRLPEPSKLEEAFSHPLSRVWGPALEAVHGFVRDPASPWRPAVYALQALASVSSGQSAAQAEVA
jgi:superfamily II DNA or RNA helicase